MDEIAKVPEIADSIITSFRARRDGLMVTATGISVGDGGRIRLS